MSQQVTARDQALLSLQRSEPNTPEVVEVWRSCRWVAESPEVRVANILREAIPVQHGASVIDDHEWHRPDGQQRARREKRAG